MCKLLSQKDTNAVVNQNNGTQINAKHGEMCKSTGMIYTMNCKKSRHNIHTSNKLNLGSAVVKAQIRYRESSKLEGAN